MPVTLRTETLRLRMSALGGENPLPHMPPPPAPPEHPPREPALVYSAANHIHGCLPYRLQDRYDRSAIERGLEVAILENAHLRATFLLGLGGRLWSLVHKATGRELLFQPRVLHFANVAMRNAWFCGGVEWNIAVRAHAAHTCAPLFAARTRTDDGRPALRLWEYDRFRGRLFQIDAMMPADEAVLLVRPRVVNPNAEETPMYWWSNIAVAEAEGHRVVVPAEAAHQYGYSGEMEEVPVPVRDGIDASYPTNIPSAHDYFYRIPEGNRPWIASLDAEGRGLVHASTRRMKGRKLFVWGMGPGGRRWQGHLGGEGTGYVEIQGGLGRTQLEYVPMPGRADWSWVEAYLLMEADPRAVHGKDWKAAHRCVEGRLDAMLPQARLEALLAETAAMADRPPEEVLRLGTGWGALEAKRRRAEGEPPLAPPSMPFEGAAADGDVAAWMALVEKGALPHRRPDEEPGPYVAGAAWRRRLGESVRAGPGDHWLAWLHLGVAALRAGDEAGAAEAWRRSLEKEPSAWAHRNLAVLAKHAGRAAEAADHYLRASALVPDRIELQVECGQALAEAAQFEDLARWLAALPAAVGRAGRIALLAARSALEQGDFDRAEQVLEGITLADVREGEIALTDLWFEIQERRIARAEGVPIDEALKERVRKTFKPPERLDFRMSVK